MSTVNYNVNLSNSAKHERIISNIINMIAYRKWINDDEDNINNIVREILSNKRDEKIYNIKLQMDLIKDDTYCNDEIDKKNFNGTHLIIYIINQKIATKPNFIIDFINKNNNTHKIIVVDSITDKIRQSLYTNKYTEVFQEQDFMVNLSNHVCWPTSVSILSNDEVVELMESYRLKKKELPKIFDIDPMSRYLFLKRGQIIRIVRNSQMTGQAIAYRIVIHGHQK